jgi:hypothetical protein
MALDFHESCEALVEVFEAMIVGGYVLRLRRHPAGRRFSLHRRCRTDRLPKYSAIG